MTQSILYALAAMFFYGFSDAAYKKGMQKGAPPHQFLMVQTWCLLPLVIMYGIFTGSLSFGPAALWGVLASVFSYIAFLSFAKSLRSGAVTVVVPVFRLGFVVTALLAVVFLSESLSLAKLVGLVLAIAAVWLLLGAQDASLSGLAKETLALVAVATVAFGITNFLFKLGLVSGATPATVLVAQAGGIFTIATVASIVTDRGLKLTPGVSRWGPTAGILLTLAFTCLLHGLSLGEASIVVPIAQFGFVVAAIIGFVFFKEAITKRKILGLLCASGAVLLLAVAARQSLDG